MPESNEKPSFKNLRFRIADRAASGKNVILSPSTALQVVAALGHAHLANAQSDFHFAVEQWTQDDLHVEEVMAKCRSVLVANAAFEAAVKQRPRSLIYLRNGTRVLARHEPVKS
jgi:hypothetical protein